MKKKLDVSILSANFNNELYLIDYLESIKNSDFLPSEIIIVDDGSTDNSVPLIKRFIAENPHLKIILVPLVENVGFCQALNLGLNKVSKNFVLRCDPDDIITSDRIWLQYLEFLNNPKLDIVGSNVRYFSSNEVAGASNFPSKHENILKKYICGEHGLIHGAVMIRASLYKKYQYRTESYPSEEYDIFSRMLKDGAISVNIKKYLTNVRIHNGSVSYKMPFETVRLRHQLRSEIWGLPFSKFNLLIDFLFINLYRKSLHKNNLTKYLFLLIASVLKPKVLISRFKIDKE